MKEQKMYKNENLGIVIPTPSHISWSGRYVESTRMVFDKEKAKIEPLDAVHVFKETAVLFKKTVHAPGIQIDEPEVTVNLFTEEKRLMETSFVQDASEKVKQNVENALRRLGQNAVRLEKAESSLESVGVDWREETDEEDEVEAISSLRKLAVDTDTAIQESLARFAKRVEVIEESEWVSISDLRETDIWDATVEHAFNHLFNGKEIPEIEPSKTPVKVEDDGEDDLADDIDSQLERACKNLEAPVKQDNEEETDFKAPSVDEDSI